MSASVQSNNFPILFKCRASGKSVRPDVPSGSLATTKKKKVVAASCSCREDVQGANVVMMSRSPHIGRCHEALPRKSQLVMKCKPR